MMVRTKNINAQQPWIPSFVHAEGRALVLDTTNEKVIIVAGNASGLEFSAPSAVGAPARPDLPYPGSPEVDYFAPQIEHLRRIRSIGFNAIRLPIEWARLAPGWEPSRPLPEALDPGYLGIIQTAVNNARDQQLYVILDLHSFLRYWARPPARLICVNDSADHQRLLARTWRLLAAAFSQERAVLGYDLMNEPIRPDPPAQLCGSCNWPQIAQNLIAEIRQVDRNHLIFVAGIHYSLASRWAVDNGLSPFVRDTISPPRIVYAPHAYLDFDDNSLYTSPGEEVGPAPFWPYYVRDRLLQVIDWSVDNDVPIFIGETNVPCGQEWALTLDYAFRKFFDPLRISVGIWQYSDVTACPLRLCPLNIPVCRENYQESVLRRFPGRVYQQLGEFTPVPFDSLVYADDPAALAGSPRTRIDDRVNPWDAGAGFYGDVEVNFCATERAAEGRCSLRMRFPKDDFSALKFSHRHGLDTRLHRSGEERYTVLSFQLYRDGRDPDLRVFTTSPAPRPGCQDGSDPEFPTTFRERPSILDYLPAYRGAGWYTVIIPLERIVSRSPALSATVASRIINGIVFQNTGGSQGPIYLDSLRLEVDAPRISSDGFTNAATGREGPVAPGEIVSIFGVNLGPPEGCSAVLDPATGRLPTLLCGTRVFFAGTPAPLFFARSDQINAQVPYSVAERSSASVVFQGVRSNVVNLSVERSVPGLFTYGSGRGPAVAFNQDGTLNTRDLPAGRGEVVTLFGTGEGQTAPPGLDGLPCPANRLTRPPLSCSLRIGGQPADVRYCGCAPGFSGLLQVNAQISQSSTIGEVPVILTVGNSDSRSDVTIFVR